MATNSPAKQVVIDGVSFIVVPGVIDTGYTEIFICTTDVEEWQYEGIQEQIHAQNPRAVIMWEVPTEIRHNKPQNYEIGF